MNDSIKNTSLPEKQEANTSRFNHKTQRQPSPHPAIDGSTSSWDSPDFEEFDLCMEVTAYVQQWD